ncbi:uncharacterized protein [Eurosta solidaginis]|uniref:uncharacterized protein n=1 Tax=Eurosta solidaginis TaxID=178769 RepID=UPI003530D449
MESILLSNIAAIIVKDVLIDDDKSKDNPKKYPIDDFPLLSSDSEDEAFQFFLNQRRRKTEGFKNFPEVKNHIYGDVGNSISSLQDATKRQNPVEINLINKFDTNIFEGYLHMRKITFLRIFKRLRHYLPDEHAPSTATPQSMFSLALWKLSTDEHFQDIGRKFNITKEICQKMIRFFWRRISTQYESLIQWPSTPEKQAYTLQSFQAHQQLKKFHLLFGVLATKQLAVFLENENEERQVILQIICDADQKVIDCFLALTSDYSFDASPIGKTLSLNVQTLPVGSYLIGDETFPLKPYLMRPIGAPSDGRAQAFNDALQSAVIFAQQVLDTMAKRFNALYAVEARNLHEVRKIVDTICVVHNLCVEMEDDYLERKMQDKQFSWAKMKDNATNKQVGDETDKEGRSKRDALIAAIIP